MRLELDDIQGMALRAYRFPFGCHHFFRISDQRAALAWLGRISGQVTTVAAVDRQPASALNIALSWQGLRALGLAEEALASFPDGFRSGMAARAARLGDVGDSAPGHWDAPFGRPDLHLLATISAATQGARQLAAEALRGTLIGSGLDLLLDLDVALLPGPDGRPRPIEHFGYRDGIGQPAIEGSGVEAIPGQGVSSPDGAWRPLRPGEFVLGQPDETGALAAMPEPRALGCNGSYLVLRKLHQHVARFRAFLNATALATQDTQDTIAARLMGRWRSGAPLAVTPDADDPAMAEDPIRNNDFSYSTDLRGTACPVGAHIRRMNPRAGLSGPAGASVHRHRVLRQGLPYGAALPSGVIEDDGVDRGAAIILMNADIEQQFEFVQKVWINDGDFAGLGAEKDPIIGANDGGGTFTVPRRGQPRRRLSALPAFVSTRGGEYFLLPGIRALQYLASADPAAPHSAPETAA